MIKLTLRTHHVNILYPVYLFYGVLFITLMAKHLFANIMFKYVLCRQRDYFRRSRSILARVRVDSRGGDLLLNFTKPVICIQQKLVGLSQVTVV